MAMRVTGMNSGLDTETIIQQLVEARRVKVDDIKGEQTLLGWKQDAWKDLNTKIYNLYNGTLSNLKYQGSFVKKTTTVSNTNAVSVITDDTAMDSVQSLKINNLAKAGYLTGAKLEGKGGQTLSSGSKVTESLEIAAGSKFEVSTNGKTTEITIDADTTISSLVSQLKNAGVNASFDAGQQRLYIGATKTGEQYDFALTASNDAGTKALDELGILVYDESALAAYEAYVNMSDTAKEQAIATEVSALLKKYTADKDALDQAIKELEETQAKLVADYKENYSDGIDITNNDIRADRLTTVKSQIEALKEKKEAAEDKTLSEEDQAELNKLTGELSYLEGYEKNAADLTTNKNALAALETDGYLVLGTDGTVTAGTKLTALATANIEAKITTASAVITKANNESETEALTGSVGAYKQVAEDAEIELNGATYTSTDNSIKVNGLTITCNAVTAAGEEITLTTKNDTSGIYDMIKSFITEYSKLMNEMDKLYNADSAKGYDPLTEDEKDSMSESEIEKWETKIKDSLLRRDSTLSTVSSAMREIMASGFAVNGKTMYLYDFGIETLGYFNAADNEKNAYHINGDEDDSVVRNETNDLMAMISSDPDSVVSFFTQLSQSLSDKMYSLMGTSEYSSVNKVYDDKKMQTDYDDYTTRIAEAEEKLIDYEDKWYSKFSAMETALAKMQSNASAVTSLLGGS